MQANGKPSPRRAFAVDARVQDGLSLLKTAWWSANAAAVRVVNRPPKRQGDNARPRFTSDNPPPPKGYLQKILREAFAKDAADVAAGLYPVSEAGPADPVGAVRRALDVIADAREVEDRRRRDDATEARSEAESEAFPAYYRQNFHYQSGGWFTEDSARRYEAQVEVLFTGAAGPMRRRALSLLARAWRDRDQRGLKLVDLACGSGAFLNDLTAAFPRAFVAGLDLSPAYLAEAHRRSGLATIQAAAERLPFADESLDGLTCIFLFHELPPRIRKAVAAEMARVLKPGGVLAFADSVQAEDEPHLARLLEYFPLHFHEPYYTGYQATDLVALFGAAGLALKDRDQAFLTKALLFEKPPRGG